MSLITKTQVAKGRDKVRAKAVKAQRQALKAQAQARRAAAQVAPYASTARATARRRLHSARAWTAPRLDRTGQALQARVAPRMSAMLSSAARRIEPPPAKRRRWPFLTAGLVAVAGALAAAAAVMNRRGSGPFARRGKTSQSAPSKEPESAPAASGADVNGRVHTS